MVEALRDFGQAIQGGGVGLVYYAGHGMQVKGKNYLVPVDAELASEDEVPYSTLDADAVLAKMESARNRLNILILDACRNNPFARSFRSSAQGLAQMDAPAGSYIAFATAPGHTAADGSGSHGLYTQHLLEQMDRPGIKVEDVFKRVRANVMKDSQAQQVPWESSSITGDFFFKGSGDEHVNALPVSAPAVEDNLPHPTPPPHDFAKLQQRAAAGNPDAMADLGLRFESGDGIKQDPVEATRWYRLASQKGLARGQCYLAVMLASGTGVAKDPVEAARWFRLSAEQGWSEAQYRLGWAYEAGEGVAKDLPAAARWYRKAAESGHASAMTCIGLFLETGQGVPKDVAEAVAWYRKAADAGEANGQCNLGWMYESGTGIAKDARLAVFWYRKSADQGLARGQKCLGIMLREGLGVARDDAEAARWLRLAADQGLPAAQVALGGLYGDGRGVPRDDAQMVAWFLKAADGGDASAQAEMGWACEHGNGIGRDLAKARQWYRKAAAQGNADGKAGLARLGQN
jgi:TPR repeat protein